jgi:hypothetical protein
MTDLQTLIGKKIIRLYPICLRYGWDFSYSRKGKYGLQPNEWVILIGYDGSRLTTKSQLTDRTHTLDPEWDDGNWVEWRPDDDYTVKPAAGIVNNVPVQTFASRFDGII